MNQYGQLTCKHNVHLHTHTHTQTDSQIQSSLERQVHNGDAHTLAHTQRHNTTAPHEAHLQHGRLAQQRTLGGVIFSQRGQIRPTWAQRHGTGIRCDPCNMAPSIACSRKPHSQWQRAPLVSLRLSDFSLRRSLLLSLSLTLPPLCASVFLVSPLPPSLISRSLAPSHFLSLSFFRILSLLPSRISLALFHAL